MIDYSSHLKVAFTAIEAAEKVIMPFYKATTTSFETKVDKSPVTLADKGAEIAIKEIISATFPTHGFVGEEEGLSNSDAEFQWIIDPIDGTKNFVRKIPLFTTELALFHHGELVLGVSNNPVTQEIYYATKGNGAYFKSVANNIAKLSLNTNTIGLSESYMSYGGIKYFEKINKISKLLELSKLCRATRSFGESIQYRFLAQGKIDIVLEADARIWDIAAAAIICQEAGAVISDFEGNPVTIRTHSLIAAHPSLHQDVVKILNS